MMIRFLAIAALVLASAGGGVGAGGDAVHAQGYSGGYGYQNGNQNGQNNGNGGGYQNQNDGIGNGAGYGGGNGGGYGGGIGNGAGFGGGRPRQVQCESWKYQPTRCPVDTRGGVRLLQQLGGSCNQGQTWGYDRGGIWVNNGCRAVFAVAGGRPNPGPGFPDANVGGPVGRQISCESNNRQQQRCPADIYNSAWIARMLGNSACVRGQSWNYDRGGITVWNGCRAVFNIR